MLYCFGGKEGELMNRTLRTIAALILVGIIVSCGITLCVNAGGLFRVDVTEQKLYTLSDGTKAVLGKINQPLKLKLYYTKTAARKAPDQIRFYNNYFHFVEALLEEYHRASRGIVELEIIDPRPFSDEEADAMRFGLRRFPITQEENFFFGLVLQTQFGVVKTIPFFGPERQNFIEYDISHLIDTAIARQKKRLGVLSSLSVMGGEGGGHMAAMRRMQGLPPEQAWTVVGHLQQQYQVEAIQSDANEIENVDILLVIHPVDLPEKTLFAIDQFVLAGGNAIVLVDPHCFAARPQNPMARQAPMQSSGLNELLRSWGVQMLEDTYAGDRALAIATQADRNQRLEPLIGYLGLQGNCFNPDNVVTANLNEVRLVFPGVLRKTIGEDEEDDESVEVIPLLQTTERGNSWKVEGPWDWIRIVPSKFMAYFTDGTSPVLMGCLVKGRFKSAFPDGIEVEDESSEDESEPRPIGDEASEQQKQAKPRRIGGLTQATSDCAVVVIADVDFITDQFAYQNTFFGVKVALGNNSDLLLNAIDDLGGSGDLIGLRSRGNFRRPFTVVDDIRRQAQEDTALEEAKINAEIAGFRQELQQVVSSAKEGEEELVVASIVQKRRDLELKIRLAERELRNVQKKRRERIERLGRNLQNANMWAAPAAILLIAIVLSIRRTVLRRRYVSHASDA
jgi:ABC-type uncharacterized transport system involved in gliding motility auxiliary subunit